MNSWNGLDFVIFLIFVVNTMQGMIRGATREIISTMGLSAALIVTIKFTVPLAGFYHKSTIMMDVVQSKVMNNFMYAIGAGPITPDLLHQLFFSISILICFVGTFCICEGALAFPGFMEMMTFPYATLNRKVGGSLGALRGYVFTLVLLVILSCHIFRVDNKLLNENNMVTGSYFAGLFQSTADLFNQLIFEQNPERYKELYQNKDLYNDKNVTQQLETGTEPAQTAPPANSQSN